MDTLAALAVVAQKAIPPAGQTAVPKALLSAEVERTRLDYERSRMVAEDNRMKCYKHLRTAQDETDDLRREAIEIYELAVRRFDEKRALEETIDGLRQDVTETEELANRALDEKYVLEEAIDQLEDELQQLNHLEQWCFLEHTEPTDTEMNDRRKFMRLWFH